MQMIYRNRNLRVNEQLITSTTPLGDVGLDSLDLVELVMELDDTPISEEDQKKIKTVGDAIDYLARRKS